MKLAVILDSETRVPVFSGSGFLILVQRPCDFSSLRHFSIWSPSLPACPSSSAVSLPAFQPLHPTATPLRSAFVKAISGEN